MHQQATIREPVGGGGGGGRRTATENLAAAVMFNLEHEKDWTGVGVHDFAGDRPLLYGRPPRRMYVHPDEQIAILKAEKDLGGGRRIPQPPEAEWVLPLHLAEKWSAARFAAVFDSIAAAPPAPEHEHEHEHAGDDYDDDDDVRAAAVRLARHWRGAGRGKRVILAIVQDDSTISYYVMHDGIVKPRQN